MSSHRAIVIFVASQTNLAIMQHEFDFNTNNNTLLMEPRFSSFL